MSKQPSAYPLRLDEVLAKKIKALAKQHDRTYKGQIENMLKSYLKQYEDKHGEIKII